MSCHRLLVFGDNHGDSSSLEELITEIDNSIDFVIHVGDITNACLDGMEEGRDQLKAILPLFEELANDRKLLYVWGNRDFESGSKGIGERVDHYVDDSIPGTQIPSDGKIEVEGLKFTQDPEEVDSDTILVTHYFIRELIDAFSGLAYFSGHVHVGRHKGDVLNSAFLYRGDEHGGKAMEGGYFIVELNEDGIRDVELRSLGGLEEGKCSKHGCRGTQYTPSNWRQSCKFAYEEENFYKEILETAFYILKREEDEISPEKVLDKCTDLYSESKVPDNFRDELEKSMMKMTRDG